jgi:prophage regulatory protein
MEPQQKILSDEATKQLCGGLSRRQRMRMVPEGKFPTPVKLTPGRIGWVESEVLEWIAARIVSRDAVTEPAPAANPKPAAAPTNGRSPVSAAPEENHDRGRSARPRKPSAGTPSARR